jgi:hypothetical protein
MSLLPNTKITLAQTYTAGQTVSGTTTAPAGLCRVAGTIKPGPKSNVQFEVWIPTDGSWNGKYQQIGNGGFAGSISLSGIANAVSRGYATAGTDDGTSGPPSGAPAFIGNPDVLLDYGYRAIKATSEDSKTIIDIVTGQAPSYSYFVGCSDTEGGKHCRRHSAFPTISTASSWGRRSMTRWASSAPPIFTICRRRSRAGKPLAFRTRTSPRASSLC